MKAVRLHDYGDVDQLKYEDAPDPVPGPGEVLLRVFATSVNPYDLKVRSGVFKSIAPITFPYISGSDVAGEVVQIGPGTSGFSLGEKVMGMVSAAYAELLSAKATSLTPIPEGLSPQIAGALPVVLTTGAEIVEHMAPRRNDTVLINGALGSVGRVAVYVAKTLGARVIAGVRASQITAAKSLGAHAVVAVDDDHAISELPVLDAVGDTVGKDVIPKLIPKIKDGGALISVVGVPKAAEGRNIRTQMFSAHPNPARLKELVQAFQRTELTIPIAETFPLARAADAQVLAARGVVGKIVLVP